MNLITIIGAGQLGSRHLQGVLKSNHNLQVFVVDPNPGSLQTAKERAEEVVHDHEVSYLTSLDSIPKHIDLAIVATNANVRASVLQKLLEHCHVPVVVLEKVLFQREEDYPLIGKLLIEKGVKAFVNHPRRMFPFYQAIRKELQETNLTGARVIVYGVNWGLGCNGLHFSDLFQYLLGQNILEYKGSRIDAEIIDSKREGFKEFTGTLIAQGDAGAVFEVISLAAKANEIAPISISIYTRKRRYFIQEGASTTVVRLNSENNYTNDHSSHKMRFQSELTTDLVNQLLEGGNCELPSYDEASKNHLPFIRLLREHYNQTTNQQSVICPIT